MTSDQMVHGIMDRVHENGDISFIGISKMLGDAGKGDLAIELAHTPNAILWSGVSQELVDAVDTIVSRKLANLTKVPVLIYLIDGGGLRLPIGSRPRKYKGYKEPHWIPVVFSEVSQVERLRDARRHAQSR